jgi:hypothetical protein
MNIAQIENNLQLLVNSFDEHSFIYELLLAYGQPKASIKRLQEGGLNLSKNDGEILWKKKIFFKKSKGSDLHELIDDLRVEDRTTKHSPRFIIVTDFRTLLARDTKTNDTLDIDILEIPRYFDFFLPLAGMEKAQHQFENPADVKAAERMGKLYDEIKKDNTTDTEEEVHNLNVFLTRLLFCFFAEDTNIFEKSQFTHSLINHTQDDGSDLHTHFERLFQVMNNPDNNRGNIPSFLNSFPYVNGGLFRSQHNIPQFSRKSRTAIIESGELDWSAINPDIFGSMIQAVITPEHRGGLGMHYTSVPNIMKVIEPLFLNDFYEEFEASKGNSKRLRQLLNRIWNTKFFDPACGSGNFLIITYKELRKLEMKIFKELNEMAFSNISLNQFYGIELDDFAHEVAILSLWLAEHQMNQVFFKEFGRSKPALPLTSAGNIVHGNSCRLIWEEVCSKNEEEEIYLMGNPPFSGKKEQNDLQKEDLKIAFDNQLGVGVLDYVSIWFLKASKFITNSSSNAAFVSTNSIIQGEQVSILWDKIFNLGIKIQFAFRPFVWQNNAKNNASVHVVIIGLSHKSSKRKKIIVVQNQLEFISKTIQNINPYLIEGNDIVILRRSTPISNIKPLIYGSMPIDNGALIFDALEYRNLVENAPNAKNYLRKMTGGYEFLNKVERYCLWVNQDNFKDASSVNEIKDRIDKCREYRLTSNRITTNKMAEKPYLFGEIRQPRGSYIILPKVSSDRREYIPCDYLSSEIIVTGSALFIETDENYTFAIVCSKMFNIWTNAVCGRMKSDPQISASIVYNTFPFPNISENIKNELGKYVFQILNERENHSEKTLSQLYDPDKMPEGLRDAHHQLDLAIERCYRSKPFDSDEERLEYLFKLYEQMIEEEKSKGTLFEMESKPKKKKK